MSSRLRRLAIAIALSALPAVASAAPVITNLTPGAAVVGASVTITGYGFGASQGASSVTFNGLVAAVASWSDTRVTVTVPAGATTGNVVLRTASPAANSNGVAFTVIPIPTLTSLSPTVAAPGTAITILGTNFGATQGIGYVSFNNWQASVTSWSATSIVATVPSATPGGTTGSVVVHVRANTALPTVDSNALPFTEAPRLDTVSARGGTPGTVVILGGINFGATQGSSAVTFNGAPATATSWSATSITVTVPPGATSGNVLVRVAGFATSGVPFKVVTINSLSRTSGAQGVAVTITGTGFGATPYSDQGNSAVYYAGVYIPATSWSDTSITFLIPAVASIPYTGPLVVRFYGGLNSSNAVTFTVVPPPTVSAISPAIGGIGTVATVTGAGFGASQGSSGRVTFNGVVGAVASWSDTSITVTVPAGTTTGPVLVRSDATGGESQNGPTFTLTDLPRITSVSPLATPVGGVVTIAGSNFGATQGTSTVAVNGVVATVSSWSATSVTVKVPAGATSGDVVVRRATPRADSNGTPFTVLPTPSITTVSPTTGPVGTVVTVTGKGFGATQGTSKLTLNGTAVTPTTWSDTSITFTLAALPGTGPVVVSVANVASNGVVFTPLTTPAISALAPNPIVIGTALRITGTNFGATQGTSKVTINGTLATVTAWSATGVTVTVPLTATSGPVVVTVTGVPSASSPLTVTAPIPTVTSVAPAIAAPGASVTITGTNFGATQGTSTVTFNNLVAAVTSWSATKIVTTVPVGQAGAATGSVVVHVRLPNLAPVDSNGMAFAETPKVDALSSREGGVGATVTISGANFGATQGTSTVLFNTTAATPTSWSTTSVTVKVPTGGTTGNLTVTVGGVRSNGLPFTVFKPAITSLSRTTGAQGASVTITGTGFGASAQNDQGSSSSVRVVGTEIAAATWSDTSITFIVPAVTSLPSAGQVVVRIHGIVDSNGTNFTVVAPPVITAAAPGAGNLVTLTGTAFGATQGASQVLFNGTAVTVASWSDTSIGVTVMGSATGKLVVRGGAAGVNSNEVPLTLRPSITSVSPVAARVGTVVTVTGTRFGAPQGSSTLTLNGRVHAATSWTDTKITLTLATGSTTGNMIVTVNTLASAAVPFTVIVPSVLTSVSPTPANVGDVVTLTGTGFGFANTSTSVTFNAVTGAVVTWADTSITVRVPVGATTGPVVVRANANVSNGVTFTLAPPRLSTLSPNWAPHGGVVTMAGKGFGATPGTSRVTMNGVAATPQVWTETYIVATVPNAATTGNVVVTVGGLGANPMPLTVTDDPAPPTPPQNGDVDVVSYLETDATGSVRMITDSTKRVIARMDYRPFGVVWQGQANGSTPLFAGNEQDQSTGLGSFGARSLSPTIGRFTSPDPIAFNDLRLVSPQRWNRYSYAANNPTTFGDPDGLDVIVLNYTKAIDGMGHIAVMTVNPDGSGTYGGFNPSGFVVKSGGQVLGSENDLPPGTIQYDPNGRITPQSWTRVAAAGIGREGYDPSSVGTVRGIYIKTSSSETAAATRSIKQVADNPPGYILGARDCLNFVVAVLRSAGIKAPTPTFGGAPFRTGSLVPNIYMNQLRITLNTPSLRAVVTTNESYCIGYGCGQ